MKVFLIGLPGSGKSYWAKKIASLNQLNLIDLDAEIEEVAGKPIAGIFQYDSEEGFRKLEHQVLKNQCTQQENFIMACGGGTPCFHGNLSLMQAHGLVIYLKGQTHTIVSNLKKQSEIEKRPLFQRSETSLSSTITSLINSRKAYYEKADHIIAIDRLENDKILEQINSYLKP